MLPERFGLVNYSIEELTNKQTELEAIRKKKMQG